MPRSPSRSPTSLPPVFRRTGSRQIISPTAHSALYRVTVAHKRQSPSPSMHTVRIACTKLQKQRATQHSKQRVNSKRIPLRPALILTAVLVTWCPLHHSTIFKSWIQFLTVLIFGLLNKSPSFRLRHNATKSCQMYMFWTDRDSRNLYHK